MTQEQRVKEYIEENGSITSLEAFRKLGVTRLSAIVFNLRKQGIKVETEYVKGKNRFGDKTHFGRYVIGD